jgi:hypothetical protein
MQRVEHGALAVLWSGLHRSVCHAISGNFRIHPHIVVATADVQSRRRNNRSEPIMATTSKTRGGTRGLALRQVRWLAPAIAAKPHLPAALAIW